MTTKTFLRFASLAAVLLAGSCAAPSNNGTGLVADGEVNHPIAVEPTSQVMTLAFAGTDADLSAQDNDHLGTFVADYMEHGNGSISVSVPQGPGSADAITWFGEHLADMGVPRSRILVGTHDGGGVELSYIAYVARTDQCGDWSVNVADTASNQPMPNFGCAVQHDIAAEVADPRDLVTPRTMAAADAKRRATVVDKYEKGLITETEKSPDQSAAVANVNKQ